jgi:hypothetical protein
MNNHVDWINHNIFFCFRLRYEIRWKYSKKVLSENPEDMKSNKSLITGIASCEGISETNTKPNFVQTKARISQTCVKNFFSELQTIFYIWSTVLTYTDEPPITEPEMIEWKSVNKRLHLMVPTNVLICLNETIELEWKIIHTKETPTT